MDFSIPHSQTWHIGSPLFQPKKQFFGAEPKMGSEIANHLLVDMHAHWLPGVDDGAQTVEEGLMLIKGLAELGYRKLVATPHIMNDFYGNHPEKLIDAFSQFLKPVLLAGINIDLGLAAEYMLDDGFITQLENGPLLTLKWRYVLVEMDMFQPFPALKEVLFELSLKGYTPILAHPERYQYFHHDFAKYEELKDLGCLFQLNMLAPSGFYGKQEAITATKLLKKGWYELMGSDIHKLFQLDLMNKVTIPNSFSNHRFL